MPEIQGEAIDVSAEEERYLRRTFHRFALPYLAAILAGVALLVVAGGMVSTRTGVGGTDEMNSLVAEAASLREALAAVRDELDARDADVGARLESLEEGVQRLRTSAGDGESSEELASRLDNAHQRINALEARLKQIEASRSAAAAAESSAPSPNAAAAAERAPSPNPAAATPTTDPEPRPASAFQPPSSGLP